MKSHVNYCCATWASWKPRGNQSLLKRLQAVCNKFFRLMYGLERTDSVRNILKSDQVLNVNQTYDVNLALMMHKARASLLPPPIQNLFDIGIYRPCMFQVSPPRINQTEKSVRHSAPRVWNSIPNDIKYELDFRKFKTDVRKYVLER